MADDSIVGPKCREIEILLVSRYGATGQGLGKLAASVQDRLPTTLVKAIWRISGMRNAVVHRGEPLRDRSRFLELCDDIISDLQRFSDVLTVSVGAPASAEFASIWIEFDVIEDNECGIRLHADVTIHGLAEQRCKIAAFFTHHDGTYLKSDNDAYSNADGDVTTATVVTPPYPDTRYRDIALFIPNAELRAPTGVHNVNAFVAVYSYRDSKWFASSEPSPFTLTIS